jgi:hypothetical protein
LQLQDRHCRELLGQRSDAESRRRGIREVARSVGHSEAALYENVPVPFDQDRAAEPMLPDEAVKVIARFAGKPAGGRRRMGLPPSGARAAGYEPR